VCARDFTFIDKGGDIAQNYFSGLEVALVSIEMHDEKVISSSYPLHLGILDYPLLLHLLNHAGYSSCLALGLLRLF